MVVPAMSSARVIDNGEDGTGRDGPLNLDKYCGKWSLEVELEEEKA